MPLNTIGKLLGSADELKGLAARARRQRELQAAYVRCAPSELAAASRVKHLKSGTLVIVAQNAATAAKLRQQAPSLAALVRKLEPDVAALKVEVQISGYERRRPSSKHELGAEAVEQFDALAAGMPEGALKTAVSNLVRRRRNPTRR